MLQELSLFSGYCGLTLGLRLARMKVRTVGYVEKDRYCQEIIKARIRDGLLDDAPIWPDVSAFDGHQCRGLVDIVTGGFPCQDVSTAGQRAGIEGEQTGLWREMCRIVGEVGPRWVLLENVPGILVHGGAGAVIGELASLGYDGWWGLVSAAAVGAPHLRRRWWCLATNANGDGCRAGGWAAEQECKHDSMGRYQQLGADGKDEQMAHATGNGCSEYPRWQQRESLEEGGVSQSSSENWWAVEPPLGRVVDGCADRVGQLRALGNGVVPAVVAEFLRLASLVE